MNLEEFVGLEESELEEACSKSVRYMRHLINYEDYDGVESLLTQLKGLVNEIHASISFSIVTMAIFKVKDPKIRLLSDLLRKRILENVKK